MSIIMKSISELPEHWQIWYQEWDTSVPENKYKVHLQRHLLGKPGSQQSYSAAFELLLFSEFNKMGLNVDFQPEINGVNPDFYISDRLGNSAYVEAGVMFSDPLQKELSYMSMEMRIWKEFKELQSQYFSVQCASSSGNPGNVSPKLVRLKVQQWIDQLDTSKMRSMQRNYNSLPSTKFQFENWRLDIELQLKSPEEKERLGATAVGVGSAGFSGSWSDYPAKRLKSKLEEKFSQVGKTGSHCVVAITESLEGFSADDVQTALLGGNSDHELYLGDKNDELYSEIKGLSIPKPNTDGLWSRHDVKEPMAVIVHRGNLKYPNHGETELWLNPNSSYSRVPRPLFVLEIHSAIQKIWTRPATKL